MIGGGVTHWLMGSALFPLFVVFTSGDTELAWRTVFIVPAFLTLMVAWWSFYYSDDTPKGDLSEIRQKVIIYFFDSASLFYIGQLLLIIIRLFLYAFLAGLYGNIWYGLHRHL
jgi:uncharacterized membrane protein